MRFLHSLPSRLYLRLSPSVFSSLSESVLAGDCSGKQIFQSVLLLKAYEEPYPQETNSASVATGCFSEQSHRSLERETFKSEGRSSHPWMMVMVKEKGVGVVGVFSEGENRRREAKVQARGKRMEEALTPSP
ncbi:hypothetical protein K1719_010266 [Acacia pycnantha]|nr:hypothetical protein K1719_010266 [Acacia pycnantha]